MPADTFVLRNINKLRYRKKTRLSAHRHREDTWNPQICTPADKGMLASNERKRTFKLTIK